MSHPTWRNTLGAEKQKPYFQTLMARVAEERKAHTVYPPANEVFAALKQTELADIKAVILGQDPYHGDNQAHGLAFSVPAHLPIPPSLANIYKELACDLSNFTPPPHGNLQAWAKEGVLLLNTTLTVRAHQAQSHAHLGWQTFTDQVIRTISDKREHIVFLLWGRPAQQKMSLIDSRHLILTAPHPSPLSAYRGFFGCRHFSQTNAYLLAHHQAPIDWQLPLDIATAHKAT